MSVLTSNADEYIGLFAFVDALCQFLQTRAYVWGGWIPDVYSGKILRHHDDAEHLVVNLYSCKDRIQKVFDSLGWETKVLENDDLKIMKGGIKLHLGHVEIHKANAEWFHNGKKGKIVFPCSWLNNQAVRFQSSYIHAVLPEFQYVLKLHPEFMNPEWTHRDKDLSDIRVLEALLEGKDLTDLESRMISITNG